jgi:hypothetical protein
MNGKQSKKIRQYYRRDIKKNAELAGKKIGNVMKPKPKFIPWKVWMWILGFFIKLK